MPWDPICCSAVISSPLPISHDVFVSVFGLLVKSNGTGIFVCVSGHDIWASGPTMVIAYISTLVINRSQSK